ncbi:MAG: DUF4168 domain-containing protein [Gammaproteobacteria bacterium]
MQTTTKPTHPALKYTAVAALLALLAAPVMAQPYGQGDAAQQSAPTTQDFDNKTLQMFAMASVELDDIQKDYTSQLQGVQDQEKAMELQKQANERMVKAVQETGLGVSTYNAIAQELTKDAQLRDKVEKLIEQEK